MVMRKSTLGVVDDPLGELYEEITILKEYIIQLRAYHPMEDTGMLEIRLETLEKSYINKIRKGE